MAEQNFIFSGIINHLFDGLTYNTSGHFAHCSYFSSPISSQNIRAYYMLNHRIRCIYYSTIAPFYHIRSRERAKYDTLLHCRTGQKYGRKAEQHNGRTKRPKL